MKNYIQRIIRLFAASDPDKKVTGEIHQWLLDQEHTEEKETALHDLWNETEGKVDKTTWDSLASVYTKVGANSGDRHQPRIRFAHYAAAIALLIVSVSVTFQMTKQHFTETPLIENITPDGRLSTLRLPDGSIVETNSGSILLYPEKFKGETRTGYLIGEANFKVKKNTGQPFIVRSATRAQSLAAGIKSVMGTEELQAEFNVAAYPEENEMIATLIHGKIKVECDNGKESYIVTPGQQVTYHKSTGKSKLAEANIEDVTAWQKGMYVFRGVTMSAILNELERRYAVTFQYNANLFNDDKFNFRFREKSTLEDILNIMQEVVGGFNHELKGNICYIKRDAKKIK